MKTLVLCVDRDNDLGRKAKIKGPVIGAEKNIAAASKLATVDPQDTDVNAIFGAVKIAKELGAEVVTLTGKGKDMVESDIVLSEQLDRVVKEVRPQSVILVTDGIEDEQILPIVQSRVKVVSVQKIIVKQSMELQKAYFTVAGFIKDLSSEPSTARIVFGIPGMVLLLLTIGMMLQQTMVTLAIICGMISLYLLILATGYEAEFFSRLSGFFSSLSMEKASFMAYVIAVLLFVIGGSAGYDKIKNMSGYNDLEIFSSFIIASGNLFLLAFGIAIIGRMFDDYSVGKYLSVRRYIILLAFLVLLAVIIIQGAEAIMQLAQYKSLNISGIILSTVLAFGGFVLVIEITKYLFIKEIKRAKELNKAWVGKEVYTLEGKRIGSVKDIVIRKSDVTEIKISHHKPVPIENVVSFQGERVTIKE